MSEETNDGRLLLASISDGSLAARIAQQASLGKEKDILTDDEHASSEDEDEEEIDMIAVRRKSKLISDAAVINGFLPVDMVQKPSKAPLAMISVLQETIDALQDIVSQPIVHRKPTGTNNVSTEATVKQAKGCEKAREATLPEDDNPLIASPTSMHCPVKPSLEKTGASRPARRTKAAKSIKAAKSPKAANSPKAAEPPLSTPPWLSSKPPLPANDGRPHSRSSLKMQSSTKAATCFHMDTSCDEMDVDTTMSTVRDSSLTRTYDALGVPFCSLDDGSDVEGCNLQQSRISISSSYDALGTRCSSRSSRPTSPAGRLPPIASQRRVSRAVPEPPCPKTRSGPSAMELDLGRCSADSHCKSNDREQTFAPRQQEWGSSVSSLTFTTAKSKHGAGLTLPPLSTVKVAGRSSGTKSVPPMMRSGSAGASLWNVPPVASFLERDTRQLVY